MRVGLQMYPCYVTEMLNVSYPIYNIHSLDLTRFHHKSWPILKIQNLGLEITALSYDRSLLHSSYHIQMFGLPEFAEFYKTYILLFILLFILSFSLWNIFAACVL